MEIGKSSVSVHRRNAVAVVSFSNPPNNHINLLLLRQIVEVLEELDEDPDCRATVLRSDGRIFCAGADLSTPNGIGDDASESFGVSTAKLYEQAVRLFANRKPIVASVQGAAIGAGLGLALAADFRVAAPEARFSANFVKLGYHPGFGITHTLPRVIVEQRAALLLLTGERLQGATAHEWGLVDRLSPLDELFEQSMDLAEELAANGPLAVEATRRTLRHGLAEKVRAATAAEAAAQLVLNDTHDFAEGIRAVQERRPGKFERR